MKDWKSKFRFGNYLCILLLVLNESYGDEGCACAVTHSSCGNDLCSVGCMQSPININTNSAIDIDIPPIRFINHWASDICLSMSIAGDTVLIKPPKECKMSIDGGPLSATYILDQLHFHWGESDSNGTEHCLDTIKYAMEAHLVYYNCLYSCVTEAVGKSEGIAIIAVMVESKPTFHNCFFDPILSSLGKIKCAGSIVALKKNVIKMFKDSLESQEYYTYEGSLTTPPCSENVVWMVNKNLVCAHCTQVQPFRLLNNEKGVNIKRNWRKTQPINGRSIYNARATACPCQGK